MFLCLTELPPLFGHHIDTAITSVTDISFDISYIDISFDPEDLCLLLSAAKSNRDRQLMCMKLKTRHRTAATVDIVVFIVIFMK